MAAGPVLVPGLDLAGALVAVRDLGLVRGPDLAGAQSPAASHVLHQRADLGPGLNRVQSLPPSADLVVR